MTDENKIIRKKIAELSKRISACDWTPDGGYIIKGRNIEYVTGEKIKRNIRPILNEMGLLFHVEMADVQSLPACGVKENHVLIRGFVVLTDVESGEHMNYPIISEGADAGDKAVLTGVSYLKRMFWINNFDIIDGLEKVEDEGQVASSDVVANLRRAAIPETPAADLRTTPPKTSTPAPAVTSPNEGNIAMMQIKAMDNALAVIKKADEEGKIMHEYYEKALEIRQKASCREDVQAILNIRKELGL